MKGQQEKRARNRRLEMRQKCRLIDNQISVNLSKLDELLQNLKSHKPPLRLCTITQVDEHTLSDSAPCPHPTPNQPNNSLHIKFKYSIQRQYQFDETHTNNQHSRFTLEREFQTMRRWNEEKEEIKQVGMEGYPSTSEFTPSPSRREEEELLMDGYGECAQSKEGGKEWGRGNVRCALQTKLSQSHSISVETRYDWINSYLDTQLNDTIITGLTPDGEQITLISFNPSLDHFQCQLNHPQQEATQRTIQKIQFQNSFQRNNLTHKTSSFSTPNRYTQIINFTYRDFVRYNAEVEVQFHKHRMSVDIMNDIEGQKVVKLDLTSVGKRVRVLVKSENQNNDNMQRIMILKKLPSSNSNDEKHQIVWSRYDKMSFVQDVILQGESNYLIANMCCNPSSTVSLIFNPSDIQHIQIHKSTYDPWKSYNILCSSFEQCSKVFMSQNVFDGTKPLEFLRSNFLDFGLVLEIYQNIHSEKVAFLDHKEKSKSNKEDIQLLFGEIYTAQQHENVYVPKQLVIKFFQVTQKPARLYFPQKRVLVGSKVTQNVTIHSTFK